MLPLTCNDRHKLLTRLVESILIILRPRVSLYTKSLKKNHLQKRIIVYYNSHVIKRCAAAIMWELLNNNNIIAQHCNYRSKTFMIIMSARGIIKADWPHRVYFTITIILYKEITIFIDKCIKLNFMSCT